MKAGKTHQGTEPRLRLPRLISDNMVLQRNTRAKVWGWAPPGEKVMIRFIDKSYSTTTSTDGRWTIVLPSCKAGGPYNMEIKAGDDALIVKNILIGDVWICSGQSNMGLPMERVKYLYADAIAHSENPAIRQFHVPERYNYNTTHHDLESGSWKPANPKNVLAFSAAGYFFAKTLWERYHVPVGLIIASIGGAPAEAFLSKEALKAFPVHLAKAEKFGNPEYLNRMIKEIQTTIDNWYNNIQQKDQGLLGEEKPWFDPEFDSSSWPFMQLPGFWEDEGLKGINGVVWFRKEIDIPVSMIGKQARIFLGRIVDNDTVYINGTMVGSTGYQYPPRIYDVPKNLLKSGKNTIVIRVINTSGCGGFIKDKPYYLESGNQVIDLKGSWQYKLGAKSKALPDSIMIECQPLGLYNGMIAPLINYNIKGVLWYQGESNVVRAAEYRRLFPALITDWREKWNQGNFPFLYVQLPNFMPVPANACKNLWAELRDVQLETLAVPNTGMAVTIDIGEWNDLHPLNKKDVGYRLALAAQKVAYGDDNVVYSGPVFKSMKIMGNRIVITFSNTGSGLISKDNANLRCFAVAGSDNKYLWAQAKIEGNQVVVRNEQITKPVAVRYAWADNPENPNLYNREGLPASPFSAVG